MNVLFLTIYLAIDRSFVRVVGGHGSTPKVIMQLMELKWKHDGFKLRDLEKYLHLHLRNIGGVA